LMVKETRLTVLVDDSASLKNPNLSAKHGLCILVEAKVDETRLPIMFDTGPSPDVMLHNAKALGVDLKGVKAVVLSHGHYDHLGGLLGLLRGMESQIPVVAHPQLFRQKFTYKPNLSYIGSPFKPQDVEATGGLLLLAHNSVTLAPGILTTGEIERSVDFERTEGFWMVEEERFKEDVMMDEQGLIVNVEGKGLVVISGCGHAGIVNTVRHAQKIVGENSVYAVVGGFHLLSASDERIHKTIDELTKLDPKLVGPCHCTGGRTISRLQDAFRERCIALRTGDVLRL